MSRLTPLPFHLPLHLVHSTPEFGNHLDIQI